MVKTGFASETHHVLQGITYDTGGADIKAGGIMAGMHRDKCGSAAVAGFFQVLLYTLISCLLTLLMNLIIVVLFYACFVDLSQTEAKTPEGCGCDGNGAKQRRVW